jgi:N-acetyl-gamma-glutamyl-phosphate reductase
MINVAIVGASGFTGLELIKMVIMHPEFNLTYLANSLGETRADILHPMLSGVCDLAVDKMDVTDLAKKAELAFLAVPHKTAMEVVAPLIALDVKVVDLSADYRLLQEAYEANYVPHTDTKNLKHAVYGLPELNRTALKSALLVANPGCYPTASILGVMPFLPYIKENTPLFIDAKSGVSGAGKKLSDTTHYGYINENMFAYAPITHRHAAEIDEKLSLKSGKNFDVMFVPHLVPLMRGMIASIFVSLESEIDAVRVLEAFYKDEPFVRVRKEPVQMKHVAGTNFCDIFVAQKGKQLFISSAIDNLLKGASSAAMVNANLMCGLKEDCGIPKIAYAP